MLSLRRQRSTFFSKLVNRTVNRPLHRTTSTETHDTFSEVVLRLPLLGELPTGDVKDFTTDRVIPCTNHAGFLEDSGQITRNDLHDRPLRHLVKLRGLVNGLISTRFGQVIDPELRGKSLHHFLQLTFHAGRVLGIVCKVLRQCSHVVEDISNTAIRTTSQFVRSSLHTRPHTTCDRRNNRRV
ncbi:hypothetical protein D3C85_579960 [compost metagenome]